MVMPPMMLAAPCDDGPRQRGKMKEGGREGVGERAEIAEEFSERDRQTDRQTQRERERERERENTSVSQPPTHLKQST